MKKNILIFVVTLISFSGNSFATDNTKSLRAVYYEVEETLVYEVSGCVPGSDIAFYSNRGGGVHMKDATVDNNGCGRIIADKKFTPALVANTDHKNGTGVAGSGTVCMIGEKEFALNNMQIESDERKILLSWDVSVRDKNEYVFEVLKSTNGAAYELQTTLMPSALAMVSYSYTDDVKSDDFVSYEIRISGKNGVNYTSRPLIPGNGDDFLLYPTVTTDQVYIRVNDRMQTASYNIIDMQGKTVMSGKLDGMQSGISVKSFAAGDYIFQVATPGQKSIKKFVKQ